MIISPNGAARRNTKVRWVACIVRLTEKEFKRQLVPLTFELKDGTLVRADCQLLTSAKDFPLATSRISKYLRETQGKKPLKKRKKRVSIPTHFTNRLQKIE